MYLVTTLRQRPRRLGAGHVPETATGWSWELTKHQEVATQSSEMKIVQIKCYWSHAPNTAGEDLLYSAHVTNKL